MKLTVYVALLGWPIVSLVLFWLLQPRRAALATIILGWMLLPMAALKIPGIPVYTKITATCGSAFLGIVLFDLKRLLSLAPGWRDLPMAVWCLCPAVSSLLNNLGLHDAVSAVYYQTLAWGVPYLVGRLYCSDLVGMYDLAAGIFLGGLLYVPACLLEIRLSPQLHAWVYGFHQHQFDQTVRFGGWRPMVFMEHGLMLSMWMCMASLAGGCLYFSRRLRTLGRIPLLWFLVPLAVTAVLCKSLGSIVLLGIGGILLVGMRVFSIRKFMVILALLPPLYFAVRIPHLWSGRELIDLSSSVDPSRAGSLRFRIQNEDMLVDRACERPGFGWGGWGGNRIRNELGEDISITDGQWIIVFGSQGLVGLVAMTAVFILPLVGFVLAVPEAAWGHPLVAPALAMCLVVQLFFIDCIFNAMLNPAYLVAAGGLSLLSIGSIKRTRRPRPVAKSVPCAHPS